MNLPDRLEQIAAQIRKQKRPTSVQKVFEHVLTAACDGWEHGDRALTLADRWAASGYPTGAQDEGRGKGTHGDPTASAVFRPDPFELVKAQLKSSTAQMDTAASGYRHQLHLIFEKPQPKGREMVTDTCAEPTCTDTAEKGRQGRCGSCAKWIQWNRTSGNPWPPVPVEVIEDRKIRRRRDKAA